MKHPLILSAFLVIALTSCDSANEPAPSGPNLIFKFQFDENQTRYDSFGNVSTVPVGNAAQTPRFNTISGHYVELIPTALTALGAGEIVYQGPETEAGGDNAINFDEAAVVTENEVFTSIPLSEVAAGTYEFVRVSVSYQNYDIDYNALSFDLTGTIASFVGFNTYISNYQVKDLTVTVNDDKLQGYWAFESAGTLNQGQAPVGATTVFNPLFATSPIPAGSCLVTGAFQEPLVVDGDETEDIVVVLSVSTNQSFEWTDPDGNGVYNPLDGDVPVDMGLRGMEAYIE
mgnify:CR=1 FL=1